MEKKSKVSIKVSDSFERTVYEKALELVREGKARTKALWIANILAN